MVTTMTSADVMWQDGSVERSIRSNDLFPVHHLDNNEFCPGDFVVDKRGSAGSGEPSPPGAWVGPGKGARGPGSGGASPWGREGDVGGATRAAHPAECSRSPVQSCPDPAVYGVVQSGDHVGRTCVVKWFKLRPSGDDVEVSGRPPSGRAPGRVWAGAHGHSSPALADRRGGGRERLRHRRPP